MKKVILGLALFGIMAHAGVWSSSGDDGINEAFDEYNKKVEKLNDDVIKKYDKISKNQVDSIVENEELKKKLLTHHKELLKEGNIEKKQYSTTMSKLKYLLDNEASR